MPTGLRLEKKMVWAVGVKLGNGDVHRTSQRVFRTQEDASRYAAERQASKRFLEFVTIDLSAPTPDWAVGGRYMFPRRPENL